MKSDISQAKPAERICVVIGRTRHKMVQTEIREAGKRGAQLIEVRLDFLKKAPDFSRLLHDKPCELLATVRRLSDGGRWSGDEESRRILLRQAIVAGFDWVDLETDIADSIPRFKNVKRIISYHNKHEVPEDLELLHEHMCKQDADVVKIAVRAHFPSDNLRVLQLLKRSPKPTVAICMGDIGFASRILGAKYGAPFTYAAFNSERGVAPGIPSFDEMLHCYGYGRINRDTAVFGVVGDPIGHSLSPLIHNTAMRRLGVNGVYLPFRVPKEDLSTFLTDFDQVPVSGYSVTIPHKEEAAELAAAKDEAVTRIASANTLIREEGGFAAYNTDHQAAKDSLLAHLAATAEGPDVEATLRHKFVLLLGAGGVAKSLAHMLIQEGAKLTISNRTPERAQDLAADKQCLHVPWEGRHTVLCDIVINATSVGMYPNVDESPVHPSFFKPGMVVFDTVYTPETTMFVKDAQARGCHVLTGVDMFVRQAALQFKLFTGQEPPLELMEKVVRRALSPIKMSLDEDDE